MNDPWKDNPVQPNNGTLGNYALSNLFRRSGVYWLLPFMALAYFDVTLAAFFLIPFVPMVFLLMFVSKKINKLYPSQSILKYLSFVGAIVLAIVIIIWGFKTYSPLPLFESVVTSPIPKSVNIIKTGGQLSVFGISSFYIVFDLSPSDFDAIIKAKPFKMNDIGNIAGKSPYLYKKALVESEEFIEDIAEIYVKEDKNSKYRSAVLVTNEKHNKIYYRIF